MNTTTNITVIQNDYGHVINFNISGNGQTTTGAATTLDTNNLTYATQAGDFALKGMYIATPYMAKAGEGMHGAPLYILVQ